MYQVFLIIFLLIAIFLVSLIMIQHGNGADTGASFSSSASINLVGSSNFSNFISRMTAIVSIFFFTLSLILGILTTNHKQKDSQWNHLDQDSKAPQQEKNNSIS
ncbi:protein translocase, SecG subunit [secondary endosymbiont of Heteropsylla cubana]|uniref:Protein-export membrane protein SecG n=1 Tax=secondary endosymbiont of Heteropsylla cubana TaxID=134287 RepID=J7GWN6_9ENTR|nr:preprotein translocase subunit SecG [secondary endosymbiont of Heteropsylla cubana]AFP85876.1 protein translocase, SecG subunit [secondary endosymbiont of Heteropsylla cubana]